MLQHFFLPLIFYDQFSCYELTAGHIYVGENSGVTLGCPKRQATSCNLHRIQMIDLHCQFIVVDVNRN